MNLQQRGVPFIIIDEVTSGEFKFIAPLGAAMQLPGGAAVIATQLFARSLASLQPGEVIRIGDLDGQNSFSSLSGFDLDLGLAVVPRGLVFNGVTWDRLRSASATNLTVNTARGVQLTAQPGHWSIHAGPAVDLQATASRAAGGPGVRHVLTSLCFTMVPNVAGSNIGPARCFIRDGASTSGTILWQGLLSCGAGQAAVVALSGLSIVGSINTALTIEFDAGKVGALQSVAATGYSVT
jgi:hypothetical protein